MKNIKYDNEITNPFDDDLKRIISYKDLNVFTDLDKFICHKKIITKGE